MLTEQKPLMRALRRIHTSSSPSSSPSSSSSIHLRSVLLVVASSSSSSSSSPSSSSPVYRYRGSLKSPWSRRRRKHVLLAKQWKSFFTTDGRLSDDGIKFPKKARSGIDPSIRAEVWAFLLGV